MSAFYDRRYDVLLSTTIVESGLDIPSANTMIIHRADRFGLAQLYQLRGRVGRSKTRAYAYMTTPADMQITETAEKRLQVLSSLDSLGAGFQLASHDLDIRGAGNLLGDEQSGHIREVGFELYQEMLEEAIDAARAGAAGQPVREEGFSPTITIDAAILIPEDYVPDLNLRMALYRRLNELTDRAQIDAFAAEMIDRFGPLPPEVANLDRGHRDQAVLRRRPHRQARRRRARRARHLPERPVPQRRRPDGLRRAPRRARQVPPRPETVRRRRLDRHRRPPEGRTGAGQGTGAHRGGSDGQAGGGEGGGEGCAESPAEADAGAAECVQGEGAGGGHPEIGHEQELSLPAIITYRIRQDRIFDRDRNARITKAFKRSFSALSLRST